MKRNLRIFPAMTITLFLAVIIAIFGFTDAAKSGAKYAHPGGLPGPIPQSTDNGATFLFDTGVITFSANQTLRMTFSAGSDSGSLIVSNDSYMQVSCDGPACKHTVASHSTLGPFTLMSGEALSIDIPMNGSGTRVLTQTKIRNLHVVGQIMDREGNLVTIFEG